MPDEIIIADDGSDERTKNLIDSFRPLLPIKHVWHEDNGFQKQTILNKAINIAESEYLIFTDQDCIPRQDFIETHVHFAHKGRFLSGGYYKLSKEISDRISKEDIEHQDPFRISWLHHNSQPLTFKITKLVQFKWFSLLMNAITPARATWNGCNASGWRTDILAVNGFNEDLHYGGGDREFGERLRNLGLKSRQIRYSAIVLHLDHARPYKTKESMDHIRQVRKFTRTNKIVVTQNGIKKL